MITFGALWACLTALAIFDFPQQRVYSFRYEVLSTVQRNGDFIRLELMDNKGSLDFLIRVPRPSKSAPTLGFLSDVAKILCSQSIADREAVHQQSEREASDYHRRIQLADNFVEDLAEFFSQVVVNPSDLQNLKP